MTGASGVELELDREDFLARYWQRRPLLIPGAIKNFKPPLSRHQLAGLALEEQVESRIIERLDNNWVLHHGPFSNADYQRDTPWTLLVQAVDHYIPEVAALRKLVNFIPQWRVDDVMVSYASDGGSVGPHCDNYDVFLLQGEGERRWKLGQFCDEDTPLSPHDELHLLSVFEGREEYLLKPGDILYLPPRIAHWGVAVGECTTFSIGFRAPRVNDMVSRFADALLAQLDREEFYHDARLEPASRAGEIRPRDLERVQAQIQAALDQAGDNHWFGQLATEPRYDPFPDDDDLAEARISLRDGAGRLELLASAKLAWQQEAETVIVFANGDSREFPDSILPLQIALCEQWQLDPIQIKTALSDPAGSTWLDYLLESGCVYVE
jgi:50S ribosomal protein L16 3-hydroxylase